MHDPIANEKINPLPQRPENLHHLFHKKKPALFLDFDGTLAPIVKNPQEAMPSPSMLELLQALAKDTFVAVISGRGLNDLEERIKVPGIFLAGCHGFELSSNIPENDTTTAAKKYLPILDSAEKKLIKALEGFPGAWVERKKFAIAVHYRNVPPEAENKVVEEARSIFNNLDNLKINPGKKVFDLKPDMDWNKGKALEYLFNLKLRPDNFIPVFIGDDVTDEDAFKAINNLDGISIIVGKPQWKTSASYFINEIDGVEDFLKLLSMNLRKNI